MLGCFTVGLLTGSLLAGLGLWLLSGLAEPVPGGWRETAVIALAVAGVVRELGLRIPLPQNARQIPRDVLQQRLLRGAFQFGFELGTGVRTYVSAAAPYVVAAAVLLAADGVTGALLAGAGFGAGRALTPVLRYASGDGERWDERLSAHLRVLTVGTAIAVTAVLVLYVLR